MKTCNFSGFDPASDSLFYFLPFNFLFDPSMERDSRRRSPSSGVPLPHSTRPNLPSLTATFPDTRRSTPNLNLPSTSRGHSEQIFEPHQSSRPQPSSSRHHYVDDGRYQTWGSSTQHASSRNHASERKSLFSPLRIRAHVYLFVVSLCARRTASRTLLAFDAAARIWIC